MQQPQNRNVATIEFLDAADDRCRAIAMLHPSQHNAAIKALADETGLAVRSLAGIVEKYAYLRDGTDVSSLAKRLIERLGPPRVRAMLSTGYGQRDLTSAAQAFLSEHRLSANGPRLGLLIDAVRAEILPDAAPQPLTIIWGAPSSR